MDKQRFTSEVLKAERCMYYVAKSIVGNEEDCADAMQEAVLRAYAKRHTLREERYFKTWLVRILMNVCYSMRAERKNMVSYEEICGKEAQGGSGETGSDIYRAVMGLAETLRTPFILYYVEGFSVREIAGLLKTEEGTIRTRLHRARKLLKEKLKGDYGYE